MDTRLQRLAAGWIMSLVSLACQVPVATGQTDASNKTRTLIGVVTEQRKYSIDVGTVDGYQRVSIPTTTPVLERLERIQWHWDEQKYEIETLRSGNDAANETALEVSFEKPLFIEGRFAHQAEFERLWSGSEKTIVRYTLTDQLVPAHLPASSNERLGGKIIEVDEQGVATVEASREPVRVQLGDREAFVAGRTIADLRPGETIVEISADEQGGEWVAQTVQFQRIHKPALRSRPTEKRILLLVDGPSMPALARRLRETLGNEYILVHPDQLIRSPNEWNRLGCWLGDYRQASGGWDAIVLSMGSSQPDIQEREFQTAMEQWLTGLDRTSAAILWMPATATKPADAAKIEAINQWATSGSGNHAIRPVFPTDSPADRNASEAFQMLVMAIKEAKR